jgi:serine/threonine protein kinase
MPLSCREVALLSHLRHENVIALRDIVPPACPGSFCDVYLVYELMDTDLHQIIRSPQQLSPDHISYFIYQVNRAGAWCLFVAGCEQEHMSPGSCTAVDSRLHPSTCLLW